MCLHCMDYIYFFFSFFFRLNLTLEIILIHSINSEIRSTCTGLKDVCEMGSVRCSTVYPGKLSEPGSYWRGSNCDDDMCQIDDKDDLDFGASVKFKSILASADLNKVIICS